MDVTQYNLLFQKARDKLTWLEFHHKKAMGGIISGLVHKSYEGGSRDLTYDNYYGVGRCKNKDYDFYKLYEIHQPIWSYLDHSQGGRGGLIEKMFVYCSKLDDKVSTSIKFKEIFNIAATRKDIKFDVTFRKPDEHLTLLVEVKNRVDSGGTAARGEASVKISNCITKDILDNYPAIVATGVKHITFVIGILYNVDGKPATMDGDGFLLESQKQLDKLEKKIKEYSVFINFKRTDTTIAFSYFDLAIDIRCLYGDDLIQLLLSNYNITSLTEFANVIKEYDDVMLALKVSLTERERMICDSGQNNLKIFTEYFSSLQKHDILQFQEIFERSLDEFVNVILQKVPIIIGTGDERKNAIIVAFIANPIIQAIADKDVKNLFQDVKFIVSDE